MIPDNAILESVDQVRIHLTALVITATLSSTAAQDEFDARFDAIMAALTEATCRVRGNRSPYSSVAQTHLRLLLTAHLRVYLAQLEQTP